MLVARPLAVMMVAAGVRCVSTGTVEAAERRAMWARVWKNLAAAKEALKAEVFFLGESGVGVNQKGSLAVVEEITAVVQEEVKLVPQERVQQRTVVPVPQFVEETVEVTSLALFDQREQLQLVESFCQCMCFLCVCGGGGISPQTSVWQMLQHESTTLPSPSTKNIWFKRRRRSHSASMKSEV